MSWSTPVKMIQGDVFATVNAATLVLSGVALTNTRLYIMFYTVEGAGGIIDHSAATITGQTGSWTFITQTASGVGAQLRRVSAWYKIASTTETVTITVDPPAGAKSFHASLIVEITSGFDSSTPIRQVTSREDAVGATTFATNLASGTVGSSLSLVGVMKYAVTSAITPDGAFTELDEVQGTGSTSDSGAVEDQYKDPATQNCTSTTATGIPLWGGIHLELKAAIAGFTQNSDINFLQFMETHRPGGNIRRL